MNEGPFRAPQSADRKVSGAEPAYQPPEAPQQPVPEEAPEPVHRSAPRRVTNETKPPKKRFVWLAVVIVIILLVLGGLFTWSKLQNAGTAINSKEYQAVFFTNGQVYFGKLHAFNNQYLKLTDVYYLQTQSSDTANSGNPQQTTTDQGSNVQLIKLGNEIHGPEDEMVISKDQVLFYENLKSSGKVAQSIAKYQKAN